MRYHELALQRWLYSNFFVREGFPIPVVFSTPMDAFGNFDKLWKSNANPFKYLFDLKDEQGKPLYEPYPANLRYPLISIFRRGWRYRPEQNYSIHQWRKMNWPTVSNPVGRCQLANVAVSYRPMAWDYRWQIDHYAMRPDTQAYFVEKLMRSMWITGGTPQCWVLIHYPGIGLHRIRMFIEGDIENTTLEEPEDQKHVEFRTTFTLCLEGYSIDQDIQFLPALWTLIIRGQEQSANPDELGEALDQQTEDLRLRDDNATMLARQNVPPDEECQQNLRHATYGTYPGHDVYLSGSLQPNGYLLYGFNSSNTNSPYFLGGIPSTSGYGLATLTEVTRCAGTFYETGTTASVFLFGDYIYPAGTVVNYGSIVEAGTTYGGFLYGANEKLILFDDGASSGSLTEGAYVLTLQPGGTYFEAGTVVGLFTMGTYVSTVVDIGTYYETGTTAAVFGTGIYMMTSVDSGSYFDAGTTAAVFLIGTSSMRVANAGTWFASGSMAGLFLVGAYA
jgi:hypothetical protein